ncbi:MAG: DNA repair protein RecO [Chlamydiales bacterium]|nr:DNA repair protein RecO [Chlamydiales bacterium]
MNQEPLRAEAVVLHALPFKEYDRILTLFTPEGLLKFFVKGKKRHYLQQVALTSPLTQAEFHYTLGKKNLHRFHGGSIITQHLKIRDSYEALMAAHHIMHSLQTSQMPDKPAPKLYHLLIFFLHHLPLSINPETLTSAFLLKVLRHDGLLQLHTPIQDIYRYGGECYLNKERPNGALLFTEKEETWLVELTLSRSLTHLSSFKIPQEFHHKIETLFGQVFS